MARDLVSLAQTLQVDKLVVAALVTEQLGMSAALDDLALIEDVDDVGLLDRAETVGNGNGGAAASGGIKRGLDDLLGLGVEGGGGFVEEENLGVTQEGAGRSPHAASGHQTTCHPCCRRRCGSLREET